MPFDTSGGQLPADGTQPPVRYVYLDEGGGKIRIQRTLTQIFRSRDFRYTAAPGVAYIAQADNPNYRLAQLWVWQGEGGAHGLSPDGWTVYDDPSALMFSLDGGEGIVIREGSVLRLVYEPTQDEYRNDAAFFDYDIIDGRVYADPAYTQPGQRGSSGTLYVKTAREGINSPSNLPQGTGAALAFGNQNTGMELAAQQWNGQYINRYNTGSFMGCAFGLARSVDKNGRILFADGILAPDLFSLSPAQGKLAVVGWQLGFARSGDTYTLANVRRGGATVLGGLDAFSNPDPRYPDIFSNHFWPLDAAPGFAGRAGSFCACAKTFHQYSAEKSP